ncbi:MAG: histidinol-phosphate transaminase [Archaeoglobaceae archaeon]|nr:histidinol-phosphate transaminase [Archaeoglobaceae archaeon]MDW7989486.1 histidinol-phosphate transaminase [Archaeoglobaceae archaeon]
MRKCSIFEDYIAGKSIEEVKDKYRLDKIVKLASNENAYGASPKALEVLRNFEDLHRYPNPEYRELREKICEYTGWEMQRIVVGAGIDGILETLFKMLIDEGDEVVIPVPTFQYYRILARLHCAKEVLVEREEDFQIGENIFEFLNEKTKLVIIPFPNNPTGNLEKKNLIEEIINSTRAIVFIDEAYIEFSNSKIEIDADNLIFARTMSKAFGLANLRIGYARLPKWLISHFRAASTPFPISTVAEKCAIASLDDVDWMRKCVEKIKEEREKIFFELQNIVRPYPSQANFIFFKARENVAEDLLMKGVIIRDCKSFGVSGYRVTVGKPEENEFFLEKLKEVL